MRPSPRPSKPIRPTPPSYLRNLAVIFFQEKNISAQIDAADEAIKANPQDAVLYFIKAQGLAVDAPIDPDTNKIKLSPECLVAFREYLGLAPTGEYAAQVTSILENADLENTSPQTTTRRARKRHGTPARPRNQSASAKHRPRQSAPRTQYRPVRADARRPLANIAPAPTGCHLVRRGG